jgi:AhpD family alkylhydroperoxidase
MGRQEVYREMRQRLGTILSSFDRIPDEFIDSEWDLFKRLGLGETLIPNKYKELIGVAVAATTRSPYSILLHSEMARARGASDAEVTEAVLHARMVSGWSLYHGGLQEDCGRFAAEVATAAAAIRTADE